MVEEAETKVVQFNVSLVPIGQVDDNPYNPRVNYPEEAIKAMAESLRANGILQVPEGRMHDGRVQLAFGHMRLRGVRFNAQGGKANWQNMPVILKELSDADMFHKTIEENLQRSEVTPLEVARAIARYSEAHPEIKDKDIAKKHGMSEGQISNMKRVLRLPAKFLDMIDDGTLTFTQGRELLTLETLPNAEEMMTGALTTMIYGFPDTVEGLQKSIKIVIENSPEAAAALLPKKTRGKSKKTVTENISQEKSEPVERGKKVISVDQKTFDLLYKSNSCMEISEGQAIKKPVNFGDRQYIATASLSSPAGESSVEVYQVIPRAEFSGPVRTYSVPQGINTETYRESMRNDPNGFYHSLVVKLGKAEFVLVGPKLTVVPETNASQVVEQAAAAKAAPFDADKIVEKAMASAAAVEKQRAAPAAAPIVKAVEEKAPGQPKQTGGVTLTGDDIHDTLCRIGWWLEERAVYPFPVPQCETEISIRLLNTDIKAFQEGKWPTNVGGG